MKRAALGEQLFRKVYSSARFKGELAYRFERALEALLQRRAEPRLGVLLRERVEWAI